MINMEITDEFFSFLSGKASTAISRRLQRNLKVTGMPCCMTSEQWSIMYHLWQEEGLTQQELAHFTYRDKPSITRLINNLEKLGLVIRVNDKQDRRSNLIYLTKEGRKMKDVGLEQAKKTLYEALEGVEEENLVIAQQILGRIFQNLK
ncbi:MarR family transcriptional regulator [Sphingobacterium rhinopitheci]|nr:MarR family transcriptional regulator [Sphingobacterium rhinopitheci]